MAQSHHGTVTISDIPSSAQHVKIFLDHSYKTLLSLGQLADAGYKFQGGVVRTDHGMVRASTTATLTDTSAPTPVSSVLSPQPDTSKMQQISIPEGFRTRITIRNDSITRKIIAQN